MKYPAKNEGNLLGENKLEQPRGGKGSLFGSGSFSSLIGKILLYVELNLFPQNIANNYAVSQHGKFYISARHMF